MTREIKPLVAERDAIVAAIDGHVASNPQHEGVTLGPEAQRLFDETMESPIGRLNLLVSSLTLRRQRAEVARTIARADYADAARDATEQRVRADRAEAERDTLSAKVAELRAVIVSVEWSWDLVCDERTYMCCPVCVNDSTEGHADGCVLAAALAKHGGKTDAPR